MGVVRSIEEVEEFTSDKARQQKNWTIKDRRSLQAKLGEELKKFASFQGQNTGKMQEIVTKITQHNFLVDYHGILTKNASALVGPEAKNPGS